MPSLFAKGSCWILTWKILRVVSIFSSRSQRGNFECGIIHLSQRNVGNFICPLISPMRQMTLVGAEAVLSQRYTINLTWEMIVIPINPIQTTLLSWNLLTNRRKCQDWDPAKPYIISVKCHTPTVSFEVRFLPLMHLYKDFMTRPFIVKQGQVSSIPPLPLSQVTDIERYKRFGPDGFRNHVENIYIQTFEGNALEE